MPSAGERLLARWLSGSPPVGPALSPVCEARLGPWFVVGKTSVCSEQGRSPDAHRDQGASWTAGLAGHGICQLLCARHCSGGWGTAGPSRPQSRPVVTFTGTTLSLMMERRQGLGMEVGRVEIA